MSSLSMGALQHCHDFQMTGREGAWGVTAPISSPFPPLHLPGLVLANWDFSCCRRRCCLYGEKGFHGAFPLHTEPLLACPEVLALLRPKCNQRQLQPESCSSPRAPHTSLRSLLRAGQLSPEGSSQDNFQTIQYKWSLQPISSQFLPALKHLFPLSTLLGLSKMGGVFFFSGKRKEKQKKYHCCQLSQF